MTLPTSGQRSRSCRFRRSDIRVMRALLSENSCFTIRGCRAPARAAVPRVTTLAATAPATLRGTSATTVSSRIYSLRQAVGDDGELLTVNTPTVFNVGYSFRLGWEGRFRHLREHALALVENPRIMGASMDEVIPRLRADRALVATFQSTYGRPIDEANVIDALVAFERSLVTPNARFDRWLNGDPDALSEIEIEGYQLFKSTGCAACHQGVAVGANLFQRQGVFRPLVPPPPEIVRVPSLRNVTATAPYFHDGSATTLPQAVRRMARAQLNASLRRWTSSLPSSTR